MILNYAQFFLSFRFGSMYFVEPSLYMGHDKLALDIEEIQVALARGRRSRKAHERLDFKLKPELETHESKEKRMKMVKLGHKGAYAEPGKNGRKNKLKRSGISAGFLPHLNMNVADMEEVVKKCGFRSINEGVFYKNSHPYWKLSVVPSCSFEISLSLDRFGRLIKIEERPVTWLHGTILNIGKSNDSGAVLKSIDARIQLQTQEQVKEKSDLFKFVFPNGHPGDDVIITNLDGQDQPKLTEVMSVRAREKVFHLRRIEDVKLYTNDIAEVVIYNSARYVCGDRGIIPDGLFNEVSLRFGVSSDHTKSEEVARTLVDTIKKASEGLLQHSN